MKLKEYIKELQEIEEVYGDLDLCYSIDDEGNDFKPVRYVPQIGFFQDDGFTGTDDEDHEENEKDIKINAVCVN